jgi:hypothetical protein
MIGLIGARCALVSVTGTLFGLFDQISPVAAVLDSPVFVWELSLGIWMASRASGLTHHRRDGCRRQSASRSGRHRLTIARRPPGHLRPAVGA